MAVSLSKALALSAVPALILGGLLALQSGYTRQATQLLSPQVDKVQITTSPDGSRYEINLKGQGLDEQAQLALLPELPPRSQVLDRTLTQLMYSVDIAASGPHLYVLSHDVGLHVVDRSAPHNLRHLATLPIEGKPQDLLITENRAWILTMEGMLVQVDLSRPEAPTQVSETWVAPKPFGQCRMGERVYVADYKRDIYSFDLGETAPALKKTGLRIPAVQRHLACGGTLLIAFGHEGKMDFFDLSNLSAPKASGFNVASPVRDVLLGPGKLFHVAMDRALLSYDLSDIAHPRLVFDQQLDDLKPTSLSSSGSTLLLTAQDGQILARDIKSPTDPLSKVAIGPPRTTKTLAGETHAFVLTSSEGVAAIELPSKPLTQASPEPNPSIDRLYLYPGQALALTSDLNQLLILDPEALPRIRILGTHPLARTSYKLAFDRNIVALDLGNQIQILDLASPQKLRDLGLIPRPEKSSTLALEGSLLFVGANKQTLTLYDLQQADYAKPIATMPLPSIPRQLRVEDTLVYVALQKKGLGIIDLKDPKNPALVSLSSLPWPEDELADVVSVAVKGDRAYLACGNQGLMTVDISVPGKPKILNLIPVEGFANGVEVDEEKLLVTTATGLSIFSLREKRGPHLIGHLPIPNLESRGRIFNGALMLHTRADLQGFMLHSLPIPQQIQGTEMVEPDHLRARVPGPLAPGTYGLALSSRGRHIYLPGVLTTTEKTPTENSAKTP